MVKPQVPTGHKCLRGHEMQYVKARTCPECYTQGSVSCDNCKIFLRIKAHGPQGVIQAPFSHCDKCHYDLCMVCFTADTGLFENKCGQRRGDLMDIDGKVIDGDY